MIKGLTTSLKVCVEKITIEPMGTPATKSKNITNLYYDDTSIFNPDPIKGIDGKDWLAKWNLTFDCTIKSKYNNLILGDIEESISNSALVVRSWSNQEAFSQFLLADTATQYSILEQKIADIAPDSYSYLEHLYMPNQTVSIMDYVQYGENSYKYFRIPVKFSVSEKATSNLNGNENPEFLAYTFFLSATPLGEDFTPTIIPNSITSEVISAGGAISTQTGYFTIGETFGYKGEEKNLFAKEISTGWGEDFEPSEVPTDLVSQVNKLYGKPGDVWVGPIHFHNSGGNTLRPMAGESHHADKPLPWLKYNQEPNHKILDYRQAGKIENIFSYQSDAYETMLAFTSNKTSFNPAIDKKINTYDEFVNNKAIVSEPYFSLRSVEKKEFAVIDPAAPLVTDSENILKQDRKDVLNMLFMIDKMELLKRNTKLPGLLNKLSYLDHSIVEGLANSLQIRYLSISRVNKSTGENNILLAAGDDNGATITSKTGELLYRLANKTAAIIASNKTNISFYEFTDTQLNANSYDNNKYTYKLVLHFEDPMVTYLTSNLELIREALGDLDEILQKMDLRMLDGEKNAYVSIFDGKQNRINPSFVKQALNNTYNNSVVAFQNVVFHQSSELPYSIESAFPANYSDSPNDNLVYLLRVMNNSQALEPYKNYTADALDADSFVTYIRNSLKLSSTNPSLLNKARHILALIENYCQRTLELYTSVNVTKKDTGFSNEDYIKSFSATKASPHIINYEYSFKDSIDFSKVKDKIDWIGKAPHTGESHAIKTITATDYYSLVTSLSLAMLTNTGKDALKIETFLHGNEISPFISCSYIPIMSALVSFFNNNQVGYDNKLLQTVRESLLDNITNYSESTLIPEILSFFGIRFTNDNEINILTDQSSDMTEDTPFIDNLGIQFDALNKANVLESNYSKAFGAVENDSYKWQGGSLASYPYLLARTLVHVINLAPAPPNNESVRNINYFRKIFEQEGVPNQFSINKHPISLEDWEEDHGDKGMLYNMHAPWLVNLFSTKPVVDYFKQNAQEEAWVQSAWMDMLYDSSGNLDFYAYHMFVLLFSLHGKVMYFNGFKERAQHENLTPASYNHTAMIKDTNWLPLDSSTLKDVSSSTRNNRLLLCKIELFEGDDVTSQRFLDKKIVDLFRNYFNYNQYFFISSANFGGLNEQFNNPRFDLNRDFELEQRKISTEEDFRIEPRKPVDRDPSELVAPDNNPVSKIDEKELRKQAAKAAFMSYDKKDLLFQKIIDAPNVDNPYGGRKDKKQY